MSSRIRKRLCAFAVFALLIRMYASAEAEDKFSGIRNDQLFSAMQAELKRAQNDLRLPGQPAPYFIEYWIQESFIASLTGKYGGITSVNTQHQPSRYAGVQVRVGDYALDNTNLPMNARFDRAGYNEYLEENNWRAMQVPIDGNEKSIRATLWGLTDVAYKRAIGDYQKKKGMEVTDIEKDKANDFSRERPEVSFDPVADIGISLDDDRWKDAVKKVTGYLAEQAGIMDPTMDIQVGRDINYYINTEGSMIRTSVAVYDIKISAWTRAEDGTKLADFRHFSVRDPKELPGLEKLMTETKSLAKELMELRTAEEFKPYTGPAVLAPDVAGVFFHEALGHRLEGERQRMADSGQTFKGKLGEKILSEQITVIDDPTMDRFNGKSLVGYYRYDDEAVAARKVTLIEKGRLRNYLMSRTPIAGVSNSNGHGRSQNPGYLSFNGHAIGRMANLIVQSSKTMSEKKLKAMLIDEAKKQGKPYGLIIRQIYAGDTNTQKSDQVEGSREHYQAFKATPVLVYAVDVATGKERLVRGVELVGTPLASLEKVIAAGNDPQLFNGMCGAESGWVPVSVISPSILTAQVELQRTGGSLKRPPILLSPFLEKNQ